MKKVIIIGGGIAGLSAARHLEKYSAHFKVDILEACDRVGGRILTITTEDGVDLEMGAHFSHGTPMDNPLLQYAVEKNLMQTCDNHGWQIQTVQDCIHRDDFSASKSHPDVTKKALEMGNDIFDEAISKLYDWGNDLVFDYSSVGEFLDLYCHNALRDVRCDQPTMQLIKSALLHRRNVLTILEGSPTLYDLDSLAVTEQPDLTMSSHFLGFRKNGYTSVIDALVEDIPNAAIHLGHKVTKIAIDRSTSDMIRVTCENGSMYEAHHVLVTVSCEVLKDFVSKNVFEPQIPEYKMLAIDSLSMGQLSKICFKFTEPIKKELMNYRFFPSSHNFDERVSDSVEQLTSITRINGSDWWSMWLPGKYTQNAIANKSKFVSSILTRLKVLYPTFPNVHVDPNHIHISTWVTDERFKGSWSFIRTGVDSQCTDDAAKPIMYDKNKCLYVNSPLDVSDHQYVNTPKYDGDSRPINAGSKFDEYKLVNGFSRAKMCPDVNGALRTNDCCSEESPLDSSGCQNDDTAFNVGGFPHLFFAGEAMDRKFYSTSHAAFVTGIREAERLAKLYGKSTV